MKTFSISTLGCKVNQYESQQIRQYLQGMGLDQVQPQIGPDLFVVNTCCVTATASAKCRQFIRKNQRLYPNSIFLVCGCLPILKTEELPDLGLNVHLVRQRQDLTAYLNSIVGQPTNTDFTHATLEHGNRAIRPDSGLQIKDDPSLKPSNLPHLTQFTDQTRAFLKIQDGCDAHCTYCIIPQTRPNLSSKPATEVLSEARDLVASGHKEIVITGVFVGAYGRTTARRRHWQSMDNPQLCDLLAQLATIEGLARIRLSSLEPADLTGELVNLMASTPTIVPHVHLSLQSGSDRVLKKMCRQYRREDFLSIVELIQSRLDRPAITTDIIVGFPGETDADFDDTVSLARTVGFAKMHVFPFSGRQDTPAVRMKDPVPHAVSQERAQVLRNLDLELGKNYRTQFINHPLRVLIEKDGPHPYGLSDRYIKVYLPDLGSARKNDLVQAHIQGHHKDGLIATLATSSES